MASIYDIKPQFQNLLRPYCQRLAAAGVTANQVTVAACALSVVTGLLIHSHPSSRGLFFLVPIVLFVRMALNAIDGMLAREHGQKSALGGILNELTDVISDFALYLPLARISGVDEYIVFVFVWLAALTEMTGVVGVQIGASRRYDGPLGKSDRAFVIGALFFLLGCGLMRRGWADVVLIVLSTLSVITILNRARSALREIGK